MDFMINDHILWKECSALAQEIFDEVMGDAGADADPENYRDEMSDRAHETADGHEWVIYTYKAHMLCAHCDTTLGEEFLDETGMPENPTYDSLGSIIAYGTIRGMIEQELAELIDAWEPAEDA